MLLQAWVVQQVQGLAQLQPLLVQELELLEHQPLPLGHWQVLRWRSFQRPWQVQLQELRRLRVPLLASQV